MILKIIVKIDYLDLEGNLLSNWYDISLIINQIDHLQTLILSKNPILYQTIDTFPLSLYSNNINFKNLQILFLNHLASSNIWNIILLLSSELINLQELHLCNNNIQTLADSNINLSTNKKITFIKFR